MGRPTLSPPSIPPADSALATVAMTVAALLIFHVLTPVIIAVLS